jgi:hypothetical protein
MTEFLFLFRGGNSHTLRESPEQWQAYMQKWLTWMGGLQEQGKMLGAQPLDAGGKVVTGTKKVVTDGPYMEGKELIGGYMICTAANYDEAVEISLGCPILAFDDGTVEVRTIQKM